MATSIPSLLTYRFGVLVHGATHGFVMMEFIDYQLRSRVRIWSWKLPCYEAYHALLSDLRTEHGDWFNDIWELPGGSWEVRYNSTLASLTDPLPLRSLDAYDGIPLVDVSDLRTLTIQSTKTEIVEYNGTRYVWKRPVCIGSPESIRMEIDNLIKLRDLPNVVTIQFIVTKEHRLEFGFLLEVLDPCQGPFTKAQVKDLFKALNSIHEQGVIVRNIKPSNIMMDTQHQCFKFIDLPTAERKHDYRLDKDTFYSPAKVNDRYALHLTIMHYGCN
ncbi:hypothetical protein BJ085DRAFT_33442 [Dimargaris cristalligena]|uniref:Protein kinase domain-containing protein n=1 Tax=Dimargaris cristalligena TaxID=215637 RepID=A0A4V1J4J2_9FUNG|nr:hypothetical protein BJ085DRAFT_33442 [Dimargaris cristalligena]|eukprot:RKP35749.1 hypothetical protein BJ085DRAFT_33442 [Dimargaris cristalligena]